MRDKNPAHFLCKHLLVCFLGLISLGVYSLQTTGLWNRLTDVVSGRLESLTYQTDLTADGIEKVILEPVDFWGTIKIWDGQAGQIRLHIHGRAYRDDSREGFERILAPVGTLERIGKTAVICLHELNGQSPWSPRVDAVDIIIPPGVTFETVERENLDLQGYTGMLSKVRNPRQIMTELIQTQAELKVTKARMQQMQRNSAQQLEALRKALQTARNGGKPQP